MGSQDGELKLLELRLGELGEPRWKLAGGAWLGQRRFLVFKTFNKNPQGEHLASDKTKHSKSNHGNSLMEQPWARSENICEARGEVAHG